MTARFVCSTCEATYPIDVKQMVCNICAQRQLPGKPLLGVLDLDQGDRRFEDGPFYGLLDQSDLPRLPVGNTPLWEVPGLRHQLGFPNLYVKNDSGNPTGSFKDRASWLVAAFALRHGVREIVLASTGNAGSSMAGIGAATGLNITLFLPKSAPRAKKAQALQYGARLVLVDGNYDFAFQLSIAWSKRHGGLSRNTGYNPLTIEGKKTAAYEIHEQLDRVPDHIFVPTGDGVILSGIYKGFRDLLELGQIKRMPTVWAAQAAGSDAICRAMSSGDFDFRPAKTLADSISVDVPCNGYHALANLKRYGGRCIAVEDDAILEAQKMLSSSSGLFTEPAGATSLAGFLAVADEIDKQDTVALLATGSGLKDIDAALLGVSMPERAITSIDEIYKES